MIHEGSLSGPVRKETEHRSGRRDQGVSAVEALVVLVLMSLVVHLGWSVLSGQRRTARGLSLRAEGLETVRTLGWILPRELWGGEPGRDWWAAGDSIGLRAFRGLGVVQADSLRGDRLVVCYRGIRSPAPEKDSVLLLGRGGSWTTHDLEERIRLSGPCSQPGGAAREEWRLSPDPPGAILGRVFERGSYYLADGALRYRRGEGGRQPLTPVRIEEGKLVAPTPWGGGVAWQVLLEGVAPGGSAGRWRGVAW